MGKFHFPMKNYHVAFTSCSPYCSLKAIIPLFSERPIMEHLSQHGFINYFGMQRFGTSNISTHKVFTQGVCTCRTFSTGCSKVIVRYTMLDIVLFIYLFGVLLFQSNLNSYILNFYPKVNPVTNNFEYSRLFLSVLMNAVIDII